MTSPTNLLLVAILVLSVAVAERAYRNRPKRGATPLAAFMLAVVVWQGSHLAAHFTSGGVEVVFERLQWLGVGSVAFLWLLFVLEYVGKESLVTRRNAALALAWPAALNALIWVSAIGVDLPVAAWPGLQDGEGALFWGHVLLSYAVFGAGTLLLAWFFWRARATFRAQGWAVVLGVVTVWVGSFVSVFELFGDIHVHGTVVGMTVTGLAFLWATTRGGLTDLVPVAASTVLETMDAGVVVLDRDGRIVEVNTIAADLMALSGPRAIVGEPLESALADRPELRSAISSVEDEDSRIVSVADRTIQVKVSSLRDGGEGGRVYLLTDVTEQQRRQDRLERQNERLDAFAGVVSHDLRNPLMVAQGFVDQAIETGEVDELDRVADAHDRIESLVDDLLTLAREGQTIEDPEPVALDHACHNAWATARTAEADLSVENGRSLLADRSQFGRLLENLFRNAVEHGGEDVSVRVGVLDDDEGFYVADDGPGIPPEERDRVLQSGFTTGEDGAGLGLAIVDGVADAHGWSVSVTESEAGGARFEFDDVEWPDDEDEEADGDDRPTP